MARFRKLFRFEQASAVLMVSALLFALIVANSQLADLYQTIHHLPVHFRFGPLVTEEPLVRWVNEGLMVLFFLLVGLEIKREFVEGHLSSPKRAVLPAIAALGGMVVPAALYVAVNWKDATLVRGWAIPTATDIVLALGVLSLLGAHVPSSLKVFLTAAAIFDDIGAVLIVGLFYGDDLSILPLALGGIAVLGLFLLNAFRMARISSFIVLGLFLWLAMHKSGLEASLAGIPIAFAVPMRQTGCRCSSPLRETERRLHPWVVLLVVPVFTFFNAGIPLDGSAFSSLWTSASLGIMAGLFIGKQVGVFIAVWVAVQLKVGELPRDVTWWHVYGIAVLAGIGFTMSLFVASVAFEDPGLATASRLAILAGSLASALGGVCVLRYTKNIANVLNGDRPHLRPDR